MAPGRSPPRATGAVGPDFSAAVLDHFRNPRNPGRLAPAVSAGEAVSTGEAADAAGGELIRIQLRPDAQRRVAEIRFQAFGCPATIACGSLATELASGRPLAELPGIQPGELADRLALPPERRRLAELAVRALRAAGAGALAPSYDR